MITKRIVSAILWMIYAAGMQTATTPTTWWIRPDGGSRYTAARVAAGMTAQCDGKHDQSLAAAQAANPGITTNLPCAFKDPRFLWDDQTYGNSVSANPWVIAGGDTVIIRGGPWRIGFDQGASANDVWCYGGHGNGACINPTIPAGTAAQHTRFLGENYANCTTAAGLTDRTKLTTLFGGFGAWGTLNLSGAQYVDVECLELTSHSTCIVHGTASGSNPMPAPYCSTAYPVSDYDSDGIGTDVSTQNVLLQDLYIHGHTDRGVKGPIGGLVTSERVDIEYNGMAGWDFDPGNGTPSPNGIWNFFDSQILWNGCNQIYGQSGAAGGCYGQSNGGYGDGVGTPSGFCMPVKINNSDFSFNTQDGLDLGHLDTGTLGSCPLSITNSRAVGNNGATFKWGPQENPATFTNNFAQANCLRMSQPISGQPANYNLNLGDFCRGNDAMSFNFRNGGTASLTQNTIVGYAPVTFDMQCWDTNCPNAAMKFQKNITLGYDNPATYKIGGQAGGPAGIFVSAGTLPAPTQNTNDWWTIRNYTGVPGDIYTSPLFVNQPTGNGSTFSEAELDNFNYTLTAGSPATGMGATGGSTPPPTPVLTGIAVTPATVSLAIGSTQQFTCTATFSDSSTSPCASPVWASSNPTIASVSSSGLAKGLASGQSIIKASIGTIAGSSILSVAQAPIVIGNVTITPATGVTITNADAENGHVTFLLNSIQSTNALATVFFSGKQKYISCGVIPNGDAANHGIAWTLSATANNTLIISAINPLLPGVIVGIHIDCWTS